VKLFQFPCPVETASYNKYVGHSDHVTSVRFIKSDASLLISTGGEDKSIFQWAYNMDGEAHDESE
jgi:WD40 repeat protein